MFISLTFVYHSFQDSSCFWLHHLLLFNIPKIQLYLSQGPATIITRNDLNPYYKLV